MKTQVTTEIANDVAWIGLAAEVPHKPPTLDLDVLASLDRAVARLETLSTLRAVVLRTSAEKYFVVGANVTALRGLNENTIDHWIARGHTVFNRLERLPVPVIAAVRGFCLGGGLELAMACDMIVADPSARFGQPEAGLGFVPGWGGTVRLPRRVGFAQARLLTFTARIIDAAEAYRIGLVDVLVPREGDLTARLNALLDDVRKLSAPAIAETKRMLRNSEASLTVSLDTETRASRLCVAHPETIQRVQAFLASRAK